MEFRDVRLLNPDTFIGNAVFISPVAAEAPASTNEDEQCMLILNYHIEYHLFHYAFDNRAHPFDSPL